MKIFKYEFKREMMLPIGAKILCVQYQENAMTSDKELQMWALIDPNQEKKTHYFEVVGTGHEVPEYAKTFITTVQDGPFVWHIFSQT